jgi:pyruvate,water dikinase
MEYEPVFKLPYSNVFITDLLFKGAYHKLKAIATIKNGKWELFLKEELLNKLSNERYKEVINGLDFKKFEKVSLKFIKELRTLNVRVEDLDKNNFVQFLNKMFKVGGKFMDNYTKTEFFFFARIEKELGDFIKDKFSFEDVLSKKINISYWPEDKKKLAEYIINMQHLKFELRKVLNEIWMGPTSVLSKVLEQLVIRTGREDSLSMTLEEVKDSLEGKTVKDVSDRHVYSHITWDNNKLKILSGTIAYKKIRELSKDIPKNEVIGTPACSGIAKGKVKIIPLSMNPAEYLSKMERGDILVSDTTGPEMIVAIEKAAAIVTDEGGMMSHAAIVSREFNIPCVVGTTYATEVFKDGDLIEVNANNGIVRRLG